MGFIIGRARSKTICFRNMVGQHRTRRSDLSDWYSENFPVQEGDEETYLTSVRGDLCDIAAAGERQTIRSLAQFLVMRQSVNSRTKFAGQHT